ncbi:MAG: thioredoxin [Gammaproteobacteria bacterium]|nr:MAG: thioredoxin [Gammaproteobacteria bacterium]
MRSNWLIALLLFLANGPLLAAKAPALAEGMVNPGYEEKPAWFKESFLDIREDIAEAAEAGKRVMLYFYQDGCPYCARLLRDNFGNRAIAQKTRKHFDVIAINMWGDREVTDLAGRQTTEKQFAAALRVQYTPTLLMLDERGKVVLRINGYFEPHKFDIALDYVAGHHERDQDFRSYYAARNPLPASGKLHELAASLPHPLRLKDDRKDSYRPLVVFFEQRVCRECDELHNDILQRKEVAIALTNLDTAVVDMWSKEKLQTPDGREMPINQWAKELGIQFAPSLVFFDTRGQEVFRTEAYLRTFHTHGAIDYVVSGAYRFQPNFQRFLQHRTDVLHARGFEVDLME